MMSNQSFITCTIAGSARWGGMVPYTVYRIDITNSNRISTIDPLDRDNYSDRWTVYRRFSSFLSFYHQLCDEFGIHEMTEHSIERPEKEIGGTLGGNRKAIVQKRLRSLQTFLNNLLFLENIDDSSSLRAFLDMNYRGASGCEIFFGREVLVRESFTKGKRINISPIWGNLYTVLTRKNELYILKSMYDQPAQALTVILLTEDDIILQPLPRRILDIWKRSSDSHVYLQFPNEEEFGWWIRTISSSLTVREKISFASRRSSASKQEQMTFESKTWRDFSVDDNDALHGI